MSYILDALKKADHDRKLAETPKLQGVYPMMVNTYRQYPWVLISIIVAINIILLILLFWTTIFPTPIEKPNPVIKSEFTDNNTIKPAIPVFSKNTPINQEDSLNQITKKSQTVDVNTIKPTVLDSTYSQQSSLTDQAQIPPAPVPPAQSPKKSSKQSASPPVQNIPLLKKMPIAFQKSVPTLEINAHVYSSLPQERFVLINGRRYTEGMRIQEGGILENIRTNDIIVNYNQQRFRLKRP